MKVRVVEWRYYVPDCPADLEVSDGEVLGVLTVDQTVDERQRQLVERYKHDRIEEDHGEATMTWRFNYRDQQGRPYTEEQKAKARAIAAEERAEAEADFDGFYGGYFNHYDYELDAYTRPYRPPQEVTA